MTHHHHHPHGHHPHDRRVYAVPSLLRMSVWERLAGAAGMSASLWVAVLWAMR